MISVFALLAYGVCATMHCAAPTQPPATVEVPEPHTLATTRSPTPMTSLLTG